MDYSELSWIEAPDHPSLLFAEFEDKLILRYFNTPIKTSWEGIARISMVRKTKCGKIHKPNPADIKRTMKAIIGEPCTPNKLNGLRLFVKLFEEGKIQRRAN